MSNLDFRNIGAQLLAAEMRNERAKNGMADVLYMSVLCTKLLNLRKG